MPAPPTAAAVQLSPLLHQRRGLTFTVTGTPNANVVLTLPASATLTRSGGTETMSIGTFNSNPAGAFQLGGTGSANFSVGGTLTVASGQVAGVYNGTFSVSVEYQ